MTWPAPLARRTGEGIAFGELDAPPTPTGPGRPSARLRRAERAALLLPLRDCAVLPALPPFSGRSPQVTAAVRLRLASLLRRDRSPEGVVVDWTRTPSGLLAAGATTEAVTVHARRLQAAGMQVAVVEPAVLAALRAICHRDPATVLVLRLATDEAELIVGSGQDVLLARRFPWSDATPDSLALEVDQTLQTLSGREGAPGVERVLLTGSAPWDLVVPRLAGRLGIPVELGAQPHPGWGRLEAPLTHLAALGGLLPEP